MCQILIQYHQLYRSYHFLRVNPLVPGLKLLEYISSPLLQDYVVKRPKFMFHEGREHEKRFNFPFLNSDTAFKNSTPEKFANIWQTERDKLRAKKFEAARIHFYVTFSLS